VTNIRVGHGVRVTQTRSRTLYPACRHACQPDSEHGRHTSGRWLSRPVAIVQPGGQLEGPGSHESTTAVRRCANPQPGTGQQAGIRLPRLPPSHLVQGCSGAAAVTVPGVPASQADIELAGATGRRRHPPLRHFHWLGRARGRQPTLACSRDHDQFNSMIRMMTVTTRCAGQDHSVTTLSL
jgi:hypothetical protein